jgi:hypothetical protein
VRSGVKRGIEQPDHLIVSSPHCATDAAPVSPPVSPPPGAGSGSCSTSLHAAAPSANAISTAIVASHRTFLICLPP